MHNMFRPYIAILALTAGSAFSQTPNVIVTDFGPYHLLPTQTAAIEQSFINAFPGGGSTETITVALKKAGPAESLLCSETDPVEPTDTQYQYNVNLDQVASSFGFSHFVELFNTPYGQQVLETLADHEFAHSCMVVGGAPCTPAGDERYKCAEMAADNFVADKLRKELAELCEAICDLEEDASDPPTQAEQQEIDAKRAEADAKCKVLDKIRDKWNREENAEFLCLNAVPGDEGEPDNDTCADFNSSNPDCAEAKMPPPVPNTTNNAGGYGDNENESERWPDPPTDEKPKDCDFEDTVPNGGPDNIPGKPEVIANSPSCDNNGSSNCDCEEEEEEEDETPGDLGDDKMPVPPGGSSIHSDIRGDNLHIDYIVRNNSRAEDSGRLDINMLEKNPIDSKWDLSQTSITLGYKAYLSIARDSHDIFVLGNSERSGTWILERIALDETPGSFGLTRQASSEPIGASVITPELTSLIFGGGPYIEPDSRSPLPHNRGIIWTGNASSLNAPAQLFVDPDGRYVALHDTGRSEVIKFDLLTTVSPSVIANTTNVPDMALAFDMDMWDSTLSGRVISIRFRSSAAQYSVMLTDSANDAIFEGIAPMTRPQLAGGGGYGSSYRTFGRLR